MLQRLVKLAKEKVRKNPELGSQIAEIIELAAAEIEDGGSSEREIELAIRDINALCGGAK